MAVLEALVNAHPDNAAAFNSLAWLLRKTDPGRALGYARRALLLSPTDPEIQHSLATLLLDRGDSGQAAELLERAYASAPRDQEIARRYAEALHRAGRADDARRLLLEIRTDNCESC